MKEVVYVLVFFVVLVLFIHGIDRCSGPDVESVDSVIELQAGVDEHDAELHQMKVYELEERVRCLEEK